ncbi:hypothetical protein CGI12_18695 [Vibrio parahaemolyticus]|nr:hypothetical protein CGI12_18695 [Vibrio parahaemolyticus]
MEYFKYNCVYKQYIVMVLSTMFTCFQAEQYRDRLISSEKAIDHGNLIDDQKVFGLGSKGR